MRTLAPSLLLYLSLLLDALPLAQAVRFPLLGRIGGFGHHDANIAGLARRASLLGTPDITNMGNMMYQTNITLNGKEFTVLVDTGSSDLWVAGDVPGAKATGKTGQITYAMGGANGPIHTATLEFEGFTTQNQAYIAQAVDAAHSEDTGILGLGPGGASQVQGKLGAPAGDSVLDRIFKQNATTPNFITVALGRAGDPTDTFPGDLTVGELLHPLENITSQPKLLVTETSNRGGQHWTALLDKNGIIGPDGQHMNTTKKATGNRLNVLFDTGFTNPQVPDWVAEAIYGRVPGAVLTNVSQMGLMWTLACDIELNVTFAFGGKLYPIHPLDTVTNATQGPPDDSGNPTCVGAFQPIVSKSENYDMILGMAFLRNAYMLINFGDFVDGSLARVGDPYVQLLSLTDPAEAHSDFVETRMDGIDTSGNLKLLPALPQHNEDDSEPPEDSVKKYMPFIIAGSVVGGVIILILIIAVSYRSSRKSYRRLHDPAPSGMPTLPVTNEPTRRY